MQISEWNKQTLSLSIVYHFLINIINFFYPYSESERSMIAPLSDTPDLSVLKFADIKPGCLYLI